jgi:hypothetical protein
VGDKKAIKCPFSRTIYLAYHGCNNGNWEIVKKFRLGSTSSPNRNRKGGFALKPGKSASGGTSADEPSLDNVAPADEKVKPEVESPSNLPIFFVFRPTSVNTRAREKLHSADMLL